MDLANKINVPLTSISDIKKAPMKIFSMSKDKKSAVYVLNKNKEVGVMLDIDEYNKMMDFIDNAYKLIDEVNEITYQQKVMSCLENDTGNRLTNEEVLGKDWEEGLDRIPDEWEWGK